MIAFDCNLPRDGFAFDVKFESDAGVTALFGPSGAGKSTVIQLIAGLTRPQRGRISVAGKVLVDTDRGVALPTHKRGVGLVFQDSQLFPHLSVRQNLTYGRFFSYPGDNRLTLEAVIDVLGIAPLLERSPRTLSGGERQRVAIGRALLASPSILLMDEPLASLDTSRKLEILPFIERLRDDVRIPILYVSHSVEEVARLASTVVKIADGKVVAVGPPGVVLAPSGLAKGAERSDAVSMITGVFVRYDQEYGVTILSHPAGEIVLPGRIDPLRSPVRIVIRASDVTVAVGRPAQVSIRTVLEGTVSAIETRGPFALISIALHGGDRIAATATRLAVNALGLSNGARVHALVKSTAIDLRGVSGVLSD